MIMNITAVRLSTLRSGRRVGKPGHKAASWTGRKRRTGVARHRSYIVGNVGSVSFFLGPIFGQSYTPPFRFCVFASGGLEIVQFRMA
ncbi:hypothetical protein BGY98DRAFT_960856 [Russula aff. rugulosa BPL654]|nr:hypothetical protein BGY98DRAFT_960856 [Russula aff. rugulosa BPL654]